MAGGYINVAMIRPWWFRLLLLVIFALPLFVGQGLVREADAPVDFRYLANWSLYLAFLWMIIALAVGLDRLVRWLAVATLLGLTVVVLGALVREIGIWELLVEFADKLGYVMQAPADKTDLVFRLMMIMGSLPYFMLVIESFPAGDLLRRVAAPRRGRMRFVVVGLAVFLRVFQHVFELATKMVLAWNEENPKVVLPRFRDDWHRGVAQRMAGFLGWVKASVWAWSVGLLVHSLLFVPVVVRSWQGYLSSEND